MLEYTYIYSFEKWQKKHKKTDTKFSEKAIREQKVSQFLRISASCTKVYVFQKFWTKVIREVYAHKFIGSRTFMLAKKIKKLFLFNIIVFSIVLFFKKTRLNIPNLIMLNFDLVYLSNISNLIRALPIVQVVWAS